VTRRGEQHGSESTSISSERAAEIEDVIERVRCWAVDRPDVLGLLLVGSCARRAARSDSDVDLVLLTEEITRYADGAWVDELNLGRLTRLRPWGPVIERRFVTSTGLEVEINVGPADWASVAPVDPGTRQVVTDGARILHDPEDALITLLNACRP
jgi:predicted nucleotidyltransferase